MRILSFLKKAKFSVFSLYTMCLCLVIQSCPTLSDRLVVAHQINLPWDFSARILEWVAIFLRYRIFLIQGSILGLLPYRQVLYYRPPGKRLYTIARENILWITERDFSEQRYTIFSEILINNRNATFEYSSEHGLLGIKFVAKK